MYTKREIHLSPLFVYLRAGKLYVRFKQTVDINVCTLYIYFPWCFMNVFCGKLAYLILNLDVFVLIEYYVSILYNCYLLYWLLKTCSLYNIMRTKWQVSYVNRLYLYLWFEWAEYTSTCVYKTQYASNPLLSISSANLIRIKCTCERSTGIRFR